MIGTGGCGNKILDEFFDLIDNSEDLLSTYDSVFINSNINEMNKMKHFDANINGLCINGNGTGRNPKRAKACIGREKSKIINFFKNRIQNYNMATIISSADGGFGNGSLKIIANILRQFNSELSINLLLAYPKISSGSASLENSLSLYKEIESMKKSGIINSSIFIDNNKMEEEKDFNKKVCKIYLKSMELGIGAVDGSDTTVLNSASGYKVIFDLDDYIHDNLQTAIDKNIKDSPFLMPLKFNCTHLAGVLEEGIFNKNDVLDIFHPKVFDKIDYGETNTIVLAGCQMPTASMNTLKSALVDLNIEMDSEEDEDEEFDFDLEEIKSLNSKNEISKPKEKSSEKPKSFRDMMDDDFWD